MLFSRYWFERRRGCITRASVYSVKLDGGYVRLVARVVFALLDNIQARPRC